MMLINNECLSPRVCFRISNHLFPFSFCSLFCKSKRLNSSKTIISSHMSERHCYKDLRRNPRFTPSEWCLIFTRIWAMKMEEIQWGSELWNTERLSLFLSQLKANIRLQDGFPVLLLSPLSGSSTSLYTGESWSQQVACLEVFRRFRLSEHS